MLADAYAEDVSLRTVRSASRKDAEGLNRIDHESSDEIREEYETSPREEFALLSPQPNNLTLS